MGCFGLGGVHAIECETGVHGRVCSICCCSYLLDETISFCAIILFRRTPNA
jgi:hypothetical protein